MCSVEIANSIPHSKTLWRHIANSHSLLAKRTETCIWVRAVNFYHNIFSVLPLTPPFSIQLDYERDGNSTDENDGTSKWKQCWLLPILHSLKPLPIHFAEKCDIIKFYNVCYVKAMQEFVINTKEESMLSPLPPYSKNVSSPRKISKNHSLYIQMYRSNECIPQSPGSVALSFCSPLEVSKTINVTDWITSCKIFFANFSGSKIVTKS